MALIKRHPLSAGILALVLTQQALTSPVPVLSPTETVINFNPPWPSAGHPPSVPTRSVSANESSMGSFLGNSTMHNQTSLLNGGYWPGWKGEIDVSCLDVQSLTHVNYAFASIAADGSVLVEQEDGLLAWTKQKDAAPQLKVILAIGGGHASATEGFAIVAADSEKLRRFVDSVRTTVVTYALDGIDIDWEYPSNAEQGQQFLQLMTELRTALPQPLRLSTALPAGEWILQNIPLSALAEQIDHLNLMAYDFVGAGFANVVKTGHQAKLFATAENGGDSGSSAVEYIIQQGFPVNKTLLGVPLYGRGFGGANWINQNFGGTGDGGEYVVKDLPLPGMEEFYDSDAVAVFAVGNGQFITYDDKHSVRVKAKYVREEGLAGLFYWQIAGDRCNDESLIKAGFKELNNTDTLQHPGETSDSDLPTDRALASSTEQR